MFICNETRPNIATLIDTLSKCPNGLFLLQFIWIIPWDFFPGNLNWLIHLACQCIKTTHEDEEKAQICFNKTVYNILRNTQTRPYLLNYKASVVQVGQA